jgi:hypothetical protein
MEYPKNQWTRSTYTSSHGWNMIPYIGNEEYPNSVGRGGGASEDIYVTFCFCI